MLLLHNHEIDEIKYEMYYRKNQYDDNGDVITYIHTFEKGHFFEVIANVNANKLLSIIFDLDGYIVGIELREKERKNSVTIMKRNYNGIFYIFPKNCANLENEIIDYYLDYYNNSVVIDNKYAKKLVEEVYSIVHYLSRLTSNSMFREELRNILVHTIESLFEEDFYKQQGYLTQLSVLPPNVRPDNNHNYSIIQIVSGCKILSQRKKPCGFCASFGNVYHEYNLQQLDYHINCLLKTNPTIMQKANCVFLSDGDPLASKNIFKNMQYIRDKLPNIKSFESFISTSTILNLDENKWIELKKHGLRKVYWGVESADDSTLRIIDKPHNLNMLLKARKQLERYNISYDMIIMCGIGLIQQKERGIKEICENMHIDETVKFINESKCSSVFISKLQIINDSMIAKKVGVDIFPFSDDEMELQYRSLVKKINKSVRGSYGNQFVVERVDEIEV